MFKYQPSENKVSISEIFRNIRLHYMDVRAYFKADFVAMFNYLGDMVDDMWQSYSIDQQKIESMVHAINVYRGYCSNIVDLLKNDKKTTHKQLIKYNVPDQSNKTDTDQSDKTDTDQNNKTDTDQSTSEPNDNADQTAPKQNNEKNNEKNNEENLLEYLSYIFDKMFNKYQNTDLKKKMSKWRDIIANHMQTIINECSETIDILTHIKDLNLTVRNRLVSDPSYRHYNYEYSQKIIRNAIVKITNQIQIMHESFYDFLHYSWMYFF